MGSGGTHKVPAVGAKERGSSLRLYQMFKGVHDLKIKTSELNEREFDMHDASVNNT